MRLNPRDPLRRYADGTGDRPPRPGAGRRDPGVGAAGNTDPAAPGRGYRASTTGLVDLDRLDEAHEVIRNCAHATTARIDAALVRRRIATPRRRNRGSRACGAPACRTEGVSRGPAAPGRWDAPPADARSIPCRATGAAPSRWHEYSFPSRACPGSAPRAARRRAKPARNALRGPVRRPPHFVGRARSCAPPSWIDSGQVNLT